MQGINFISLPVELSEINLLSLHEKLKTWTALEVDTHVYDFRATQSVSEGCLAALRDFAIKIKAQGNNLISVNMPDRFCLWRAVAGSGSTIAFRMD